MGLPLHALSLFGPYTKVHGAIRCSLKTQNPFYTQKKIILLGLRQLCLPYTVKRTWFRIMTLFIINFKNHYLSNIKLFYINLIDHFLAS